MLAKDICIALSLSKRVVIICSVPFHSWMGKNGPTKQTLRYCRQPIIIWLCLRPDWSYGIAWSKRVHQWWASNLIHVIVCHHFCDPRNKEIKRAIEWHQLLLIAHAIYLHKLYSPYCQFLCFYFILCHPSMGFSFWPLQILLVGLEMFLLSSDSLNSWCNCGGISSFSWLK